ncbi:MCE family protein [Gordonia sp. (in: high G+C Gram-positive bacteria)]|jgi:phospholipid/cholesterol/gamma-HCH transport system substrate-binding protein|uniref:MCE family protein n=1 Tax=Gordonia sp. (in: high G+C Gram-positive bacteria) TaxID=84139 RepID=UPI001D8900AD|nr:MlaD family protein [Gordonia sp. (in: high G+C Gram-positive bacteria)]MCB1296529.1 MCE family protein [Gordonia sp. (in: high G+C Gram-positive bacteria)]HMS75529.1 MlaD family protein [Gordonia sp. (in: high G+C Gram-positive bacteria)]HQV18267.1 MlaD family protein [Gordonia sp. (in: high G+C Gram-positive bacteria)]
MRTKIRVQLALLTILAVVSVSVMAFGYLRVQDSFGFNKMTVSAELPEAAGLYNRANVTLRGHTIGHVDRLDLSTTGVVAVMRIDKRRIPRTGLRVDVHSMSAVGEQYIDLVPTTASGPTLSDGDVLPQSAATIPAQVGPLLDQANALLAEIPQGRLRTMIDAMFTAFDGTGLDLVSVVDSTRAIADEVAKNPDGIEALVEQLGPFLKPHAESADEITAWASQLSSATAELRDKDDAVRRIIANSPRTAQTAQQLLEKISPTVPILLTNLVSLGQVALTYNAGMEQILVLMPGIIAAMQTMVNQGAKDQSATASFHTMSLPICTTGYISAADRRTAADTDVIPTPDGQFCSVPHSSPVAVRGARNLPCMEVPGKRAPTPEVCQGGAYVPKGPLPSSIDGSGQPDKQGLAGALLPASYDPKSGAYVAPDGSIHKQLTITPATYKGGASWETLMLEPVR